MKKALTFLVALVMVWGMAAFAGPFIQFDYVIADQLVEQSAEFTGGVEFQLESTLSWITVEATIADTLMPEHAWLVTSATYEYKGQLAELLVTGAMDYNPFIEWVASPRVVAADQLTLDAEITIPVGKALIYGDAGFAWKPVTGSGDPYINVTITGSVGFRIEW